MIYLVLLKMTDTFAKMLVVPADAGTQRLASNVAGSPVLETSAFALVFPLTRERRQAGTFR